MKTFTARGSDFRALNTHALRQSYLFAFFLAAVICLSSGLWSEAMAQATGSGIQWTKFDGETTRFVNWLKNRPLTSFFTIAAIIIGVLCAFNQAQWRWFFMLILGAFIAFGAERFVGGLKSSFT